MDSENHKPIAIVGLGAVLPDAMDAPRFWRNILEKRYSITEVPADRWSIEAYYDPDPAAPDKTYCKIGAWVQGYEFPWKDYRVPPKVAAAMDPSQQWAVTAAGQALADYGYPQRPLDTDRTAVILGTAMGGEMHYVTTLRVSFPKFAEILQSAGEFSRLPQTTRSQILDQWRGAVDRAFPQITEDTMPGELPNILAGRVANIFNLRGPSYIVDAACASSFAALQSAVEQLSEGRVDAVLTGGVDHNMGASTFIKFSKIGALSATGSRPFGEGADGFVMGEGAGVFLLKRLEDAERDGDRVYAVIRGVGGASDGKGKGITAPNPIGQRLAMQRAWQSAGLDPGTVTLIEAHGTSTKVGDVVEVESLAEVFGSAACGSIGLGSVKSNIGHLKAGAGAAGLLKGTMALYDKVLPPTLNASKPNSNIDFKRTPFNLIHEPREWTAPKGSPRRCGVSAYGFGGTNFHIILEEHIPGQLTDTKKRHAGVSLQKTDPAPMTFPAAREAAPAPLRGIFSLGAGSPAELMDKIQASLARLQTGWTPPLALPDPADMKRPERLVIDFGDRSELEDRLLKARKAVDLASPQAWLAMQAQGIFHGSGLRPGKIAFLFPGQGSQYINMGRELLAKSPLVAEIFQAADRVMAPVLGTPLSKFILIENNDPDGLKQAELALTQTAVCQPAMLTLDIALFRLLDAYGFKPDMVMGHSLGEYAALIASEAMLFDQAVEAVAARGREMSVLDVEDKGWMAAVMAPYDAVQEILSTVGGEVVAANINSYSQCVIGGASQAVEQAISLFQEKGYQAMRLPVSHAFHTKIVAPASKPLRTVLDRLHFAPPRLPVVANLTGEFYPANTEEMKDILQQQVAAPVQWIKGLETLYAAGCRTFVEVGPKKALKGFVDDVLARKPGVVSLFTNHPKVGELASFNQALCGLYASGYGFDANNIGVERERIIMDTPQRLINRETEINVPAEATTQQASHVPSNGSGQAAMDAILQALVQAVKPGSAPYDRNAPPLGSVVVTGTGLGL
ncbi:MAG: acyltransferase domain-containing protein, partial [Chloroflexota bacterium]